MPWRESSSMDQRVKFVGLYLEGSVSLSKLCIAFGVSRKTAYKWLNRYNEFGPEGFKDQSRAPKNPPHKVNEQIAKILINARKEHPHWGPRKIIAWLTMKQPSLKLPSHSTVSELFQKHGLIQKDEVEVRPIKHLAPIFESTAPNDVWCTDFKGEFKMGNGKICYPLTISDHHSRFILSCQGNTRNDYLQTRNSMEKIFKEYGLPKIILSDNGTPFSSPSGLSQLNVWWVKLGITPLRIQPGKPQQNGRHERMHRTLKQETAKPPADNLSKQQERFDKFVEEYNFERPHESLHNKVPSSIYSSSTRTMPKKIEDPRYPSYMEKRIPVAGGELNWRGGKYRISRALENELVGLDEIDDGLWLVYFGPIKVGYINERTKMFERCLKQN